MKAKYLYRGCLITLAFAIAIMFTLSTIGFANVVHSVMG